MTAASGFDVNHLLDALFVGLKLRLPSLFGWLLLAMVTMVPLERVFALRSQRTLRPGFGQDILYFFIGGLVPAACIVAINAAIVFCVSRALPAAWFTTMHGLPGWARVAAIVAIGDFGYYWAHRWAHRFSFFWRFHAIHHSPAQLDWLVATRAHPAEICFVRGISFVPVFAAGIVDTTSSGQAAALVLVATFNTLWAFFVHSNVRLNLAWIEALISTPRFHHWHHANDGRSSVNKNIAALFPIWDRLFGTLYLPKRGFPMEYGSTTALPTTLGAQLLFPLQTSRSATTRKTCPSN